MIGFHPNDLFDTILITVYLLCVGHTVNLGTLLRPLAKKNVLDILAILGSMLGHSKFQSKKGNILVFFGCMEVHP